MSLIERLRGFFGGSGPMENTSEDASRPCNIECKDALERLYEFLDGELESSSAEEVEQHFRLCQRCYPHLAMEESFREALRRAQGGGAVPPELMDRVLRSLEESQGEPAS
jgi:anti-sigma factor (TIGR02949 family)